jgi:hypothetical protein
LRSVEGFGAFEAHSLPCSVFAEGDVDVVENLDVVAQEADGL